MLWGGGGEDGGGLERFWGKVSETMLPFSWDPNVSQFGYLINKIKCFKKRYHQQNLDQKLIFDQQGSCCSESKSESTSLK